MSKDKKISAEEFRKMEKDDFLKFFGAKDIIDLYPDAYDLSPTEWSEHWVNAILLDDNTAEPIEIGVYREPIAKDENGRDILDDNDELHYSGHLTIEWFYKDGGDCGDHCIDCGLPLVPVTVYRDTVGLEEDDDNLITLLFPTRIIKEYIESVSDESYTEWLKGYTADATEGLYDFAKSRGFTPELRESGISVSLTH